MGDSKRDKTLLAARSAFLRYGYKRVSMNDIAEAAGVSRAALYLAFKNKEDIFVGVFQQWLETTIAEIERSMAEAASVNDKLAAAFELWAVRPFELMLLSPEAKEVLECGFEFAQPALARGYALFEATISRVLARQPRKAPMDPDAIAHILASAVRGFKQTATTPEDLRQLIADLLRLALPI